MNNRLFSRFYSPSPVPAIPVQGSLKDIEYLNKLSALKGEFEGAITSNDKRIAELAASYRSWTAYGDANEAQRAYAYEKAHEAADLEAKLKAENTVLKSNVSSLITSISAINNKIQADIKTQLANANLTPQQRQELLLKQQQADAIAKQAESRSKNIRLFAWAGAIALVLAVIAFVVIKLKRGSKAA